MRTIAETIIFLLKIDTKSPYLKSLFIQMLPKGYFDCINVATNVLKVIVEACIETRHTKNSTMLAKLCMLGACPRSAFCFFLLTSYEGYASLEPSGPYWM